MHSSTEELPPEKKPVSRGLLERARLWNRKLHYYLGLLTLVFVCFFSFSGLLLNHQWRFAEFWDTRHQSTTEQAIVAPPAGSDLDQARDLLRQLGLRGEIE